MKAYTYILTGCLMAISCDPGQVIDLCDIEPVSCECVDDKYCIKVEQTDVTQFQFSVTEETGTDLLGGAGDFTVSTGWTFGTNWSYDAVNLEADAAAAGFAQYLSYTMAGGTIENFTYYKVTFEVKNFVGGSSLGLDLGGSSSGRLFNSSGTKTDYILTDGAANQVVRFRAGGALDSFTGSIDDVVITKIGQFTIEIRDNETDVLFAEFDPDGVSVSSQIFTATDASNANSEMFFALDRIQANIDWSELTDLVNTGTGIPAGCYTISIVGSGSTKESRCIALQTNHVCTLELSFTNSVNTFGLNFEDFTFTQYLRIDTRRRNPRYQYNEKIFTDGSGSHTLTYARKTKVYSFDTEPLPRDLITAINCGLLMDDFQIDGVRHVREVSEISPSWNKNYVLAPLAMEIKEASQPNQVNRLC